MTTQTPNTTASSAAFSDEIARMLAAVLDEMDEAAAHAALETPANLNMGDFAFPCFPLARTRKMAPPVIAKNLAEELADAVQQSERVHSVEAVGGYLNFKVERSDYTSCILQEVLRRGPEFGSSDRGAGKTICIDFSSPNIAKMFHVGHLRSTLIGAALQRIFAYLGHPTVGVNHIGDWGTQFGKLLVAYKHWGDDAQLKSRAVAYLYELYVKFHAEAKSNPALEEDARTAFRALENGDPEARALWQSFRDYSLQEFQRMYDMLGVSFDSFSGEAFYEDKMQPVLDLLDQKGLSTSSRDALIVDLSDLDIPPMMLRKKDEATLYATRDLAAARYRHNAYHFDKMLYVVGQAQELHFRQVFTVLDRMGYEWSSDCEHIMFGWVKFKDQHLSSREGNVVLLEEVLNRAVEEASKIMANRESELSDWKDVARTVGIGAVIFADLSPRRIKDVNFDWKEVLSFDHGSGPYLMYTHCRLSSILRKYGKGVDSDVQCDLLSHEAEYKVIHAIDQFPRQLEHVCDKREPSYLASYLIELATAANSYLQKGSKDKSLRILSDDANLTRARIALVSATRQVLKTGLGLLGIGAPDQM
jgi:arginyl-tRNA synthetase